MTGWFGHFELRKDAKFHDGAPITANDVKWSLDRAVTVGGVPTFQMAVGSMLKTEQFVAVDDYTLCNHILVMYLGQFVACHYPITAPAASPQLLAAIA